MKINRIIYAVFLVLSFVFVFLYGGKVPYMFFFTMLILPVISFAHVVIIYLRFKFVQEVDRKYAVKGEKVNFSFYIINEDFFLYPYMRATFFGADTIFTQQFHTKSFSLVPYSKISFSFEIECKYRGIYPIGLKSIEIEDFLGIFKLKYNINETKELIVYPKTIPLDRFLLKTNFISDTHTILNTMHEYMTTISDIRKFAYGDTIKRIHWKLSAKMDELLVKNFQSTSQTSATLFLDLKRFNCPNEKRIILEDKLIESAVSVAYYCLSNWIPMNFIFYMDGIVNLEAKTPLDFDELYRMLAKLKFIEQVEIKDLIDVYLKNNFKKTNIIIFTSDINYALYNQIYKTRFSGYEVSLIYISPEQLTGIVNNEAENIMAFLPEIDVNTYKLDVNDDIKLVLER